MIMMRGTKYIWQQEGWPHMQWDDTVYTNLKVYHFLIKKCTTPNRLQRYA